MPQVGVDGPQILVNVMLQRASHQVGRSARGFQVLRDNVRFDFVFSISRSISRQASRDGAAIAAKSQTHPSASSGDRVTNRIRLTSRHFASSTSPKKEYNMASDNPRAHNNPDFQINEIFSVKGKVALVTGQSIRMIAFCQCPR